MRNYAPTPPLTQQQSKDNKKLHSCPDTGSVPLHSNLLEPNQDKEHPLSLQRRKDSIQDHPGVNRKKSHSQIEHKESFDRET